MLYPIPDVVLLLVAILVLVLIGASVSLTTLIPPIRELGRRSRTARAIEVVVIGLVSLTLSFGLLTWLGAELSYLFSTVGTPDWREEDPLERAIVKELWIRALVPPLIGPPCYTTDVVVCQKASWASLGDETLGDWWEYLMGLGFCSVSSAAGGFLASVFTRQRQHDIQ